MSVSRSSNSRGIRFRVTCHRTARPTTIPWVAAEAAATQAPLPSANSIVAATNTPSASAMKSQCHAAATARRRGPGSPPVAARIARPTGRRNAQNIATL